jgi:demethylmenaquinone methyltransferase / 2-methoxy-6-polyprenyl-1,4-benzoquinol methylase
MRWKPPGISVKTAPIEFPVAGFMKEHDTFFGFERVSEESKTFKVKGVFDSVADSYDLMNDLMSGGLHRLWKRFAVNILDARSGHTVVDLAGGTADLSRLIDKYTRGESHVVVCDINASMLNRGRDRTIDKGITRGIDYVQASAEAIPLRSDCIDRVIIGFGLRNVTRRSVALEEMYRVLRPGGRAVILEFSTVKAPMLSRLYDLYSFRVLPVLGRIVANDAASYRYLAESIRVHPDQEALRYMMEKSGFEAVRYYDIMAGVVAIHVGRKF